MADFSSSGRLRKNYGSNLRQSEGKLYPDLEQKLSGEPDFQVAIWLCTEEEEDDCRVAEELSRCASEILLIADAGVDVANRRSEAELPPKVLLFIVRVALPLNWPWLSMPPPMPVEPFVIVRSEIVTVRPKSSIRNTRLAWLASTVSRFAPGPLIMILLPTSSWPLFNVIVAGVVTEKSIMRSAKSQHRP